MKNSTFIIGLLCASIAVASALPLEARGQNADASLARGVSQADQTTVAAMAMANMAEIEMGRLALTNASAPSVKAYAQKMVDDHSKALGEVTTLAQAKGMIVPKDLDEEHKALAARLGKLKGDAFDRQYMAQAGIADHRKVHAKLKQDVARANEPDVKALAAKLLPTVEQHLGAAKAHKH